MHLFSDDEAFQWAAYRRELGALGLSADDVDTLERQATAAGYTFLVLGASAFEPRHPSLLPFVHGARREFISGTFDLLMEDLIEWQALGPVEGRSRSVWRRLYTAGCPLDHLWRLLFDCFVAPNSDPQDWLLVSEEAALARADRYVELGFPRARGPWAGFGCGAALDAVRARLTTFVACHHLDFHALGEDFMRLRRVCSESLVGRIDRRVDMPDEMRRAIRMASPESSVPLADVPLPEFADARALDDWYEALARDLKAGTAVRDKYSDRFILADETVRLPPRSRAPRLAPRLPAGNAASELVAMLAATSHRSPAALFDVKRYQEPLDWFESTASKWLRDNTALG